MRYVLFGDGEALGVKGSSVPRASRSELKFSGSGRTGELSLFPAALRFAAPRNGGWTNQRPAWDLRVPQHCSGDAGGHLPGLVRTVL